jgi:hypothetical protein
MDRHPIIAYISLDIGATPHLKVLGEIMAAIEMAISENEVEVKVGGVPL